MQIHEAFCMKQNANFMKKFLSFFLSKRNRMPSAGSKELHKCAQITLPPQQIFSFCCDFALCCQRGNATLVLHPAHHSEGLGSKICILGKLNSSSQTCLSLFGISKTTNNRVRNSKLLRWPKVLSISQASEDPRVHWTEKQFPDACQAATGCTGWPGGLQGFATKV